VSTLWKKSSPTDAIGLASLYFGENKDAEQNMGANMGDF